MFVETSAIVAIVGKENEAARFSAKMQQVTTAISAPHVILESVMALSTRHRRPPSNALATIERLLEAAEVVVVPTTRDIARAAVDAFERYGKGRGHPAQLNFGDCLSYATAKLHGAPMLFKGDDFALTDIERA